MFLVIFIIIEITKKKYKKINRHETFSTKYIKIVFELGEVCEDN